jgi:hypothetical protein
MNGGGFGGWKVNIDKKKIEEKVIEKMKKK